MTGLEYASAIETLLSPSAPQAHRDVAAIRCCMDVVRRLGDYGPLAAPEFPSELMSLRQLDAEKIHSILNVDEEKGQAFAAWRVEVTDHEAANAARLQTLANTAIVLLGVRERTHDADTIATIDQLLEALGDWMARAWRTNPPLRGNIRAWATRMTRETGLLPKEWR